MKKISSSKLYEMLSKRDREEWKKTFLWAIAIIWVIVAVVGIAYALYRYFTPDYLRDFDDDFEDDFEDDYFEDDEL